MTDRNDRLNIDPPFTPSRPTSAERWVANVERLGVDWPIADQPTGGFRRRAAKACYRNAALLALDPHRLRYCEGWAYCDGLPVQHAWNLNDAGEAIDVTLRVPADRYVGVEIPTATVAAVVRRTGVFGPVLEHLNDDLEEA